MATTKHPVFEAPNNPNIKIWRYMDFTKFVSVLDSQSLFFSRSDLLGDPYEGAISHANVEFDPNSSHNLFPDDKSAEWFRQWVYINCWHMNNNESAAMWKLYGKTNEAIAIQSTYARLCECLPEQAYVGKVHYINYETEFMPENNMFYPFVHKRKSFEYEQELRAVIEDLPRTVQDRRLETGKPNPEYGKLVKVDLKNLAEKVFVAPTAQTWFTKLVKDVAYKYGLEIDITSSSLDKRPVY
jgi:hypothetical protein